MLLGLSTTVTSIINFSAMVGTVAGGGLGDVAIRYGYQQYSWIHIVSVIVVIFAIVMMLQGLASWGARRLARRTPRTRRTASSARMQRADARGRA
jgi:D-methionine transport system permease protein